MLKIRLKRIGRRHDPSYRLVVVESARGPKSNQYVENLGLYDPQTNTNQIDTQRVGYWISQGAQISDTAHNVLVDIGVLTASKINVLPKKSPIAKEKETSKETSSSDPEEEASEEGVKEEEGTEDENDPSPETPKEEQSENVESESEAKETSEAPAADAEEKNV